MTECDFSESEPKRISFGTNTGQRIVQEILAPLVIQEKNILISGNSPSVKEANDLNAGYAKAQSFYAILPEATRADCDKAVADTIKSLLGNEKKETLAFRQAWKTVGAKIVGELQKVKMQNVAQALQPLVHQQASNGLIDALSEVGKAAAYPGTFNQI